VISVLLADDQALVRSGFKMFIESAPDCRVVGEAGSGSEVVRLARKGTADVVLMDIRMPDLDGIEATRQITSDGELAHVRVLILTTFEVDEYVFEALRAGASGFIGKNASVEELLTAIRTVAHGDALLSPRATKALVTRYLSHTGEPHAVGRERLVSLTDRELEMVRLVARGLSNDAIAERLVLSPATVKTHVNRAMTKLDAHDRAQLVVIAYEAGLVRPQGS
jgi:DNA-binding NarL/FixJ family response regulator